MKFQLRDRVIMVVTETKYRGEIGTVVDLDCVGNHVVNLVVQFDCNKIGHHVRFPSHYFELYFRKEVHDPEPVKDYESMNFVLQEKIQRLNEYIAKLEDDGFKYRRALVEIQMKAQETLRPIPFQEDE